MRTVLRSISIRQKLLIGSLLYVLPLAVLLYFTISGILSDVRFAQREREGVKLLRPLEELMERVPRHRALVFLRLQGRKDLDAETKEVSDRIDASFSRLLGESAAFGPRLDPEGAEGLKPSALKEAWDKLRAETEKTAPERFDLEHSKLIEKIRDLITRVGDSSNLILDPELSSYYLVDVTLNGVPKLLDKAGELTLLGERIISSDRPLSGDLSRLSLLVAAIDKGSLQHIHNSLETAVRYDRQMRGSGGVLGGELEKTFRKSFDSTHDLLRTSLALDGAKKNGTAQGFEKLAFASLQSIDKFNDDALRKLDDLLQERISRHRYRMYTVLGLTFCCLGLAVLLVFIISRGITRSIGDVMKIAGKIAAGDLDGAGAEIGALGANGTGPADGEGKPRFRDEMWQLGSSFAHMTRSLHALVLQVQQSGVQVLSSSTEISASSRELEATAAQQAASTSQVNVTAREISNSCALLLDSVNNVLAVASETLSLAREGQERLSLIKSSMGELTRATSSIASQLEAISQTTGSIGSVVSTMTKVADQTNLLSLNATIEAEKAGKYGLGFSVVAREIQRLADQTAVATLDIEHLVKNMEKTVSSGVSEVDEFVQRVNHTVRDVDSISSELVSSIVTHMQELIPHFDELGDSMNTQSAGAEEISIAMGQIAEGAEQTRLVIHNFGTVTHQLMKAADALQKEVSRFKATSDAREGSE